MNEWHTQYIWEEHPGLSLYFQPGPMHPCSSLLLVLGLQDPKMTDEV